MNLLLTWWIPWEPAPIVIGLFLACAVLYVRGCRRRTVSWPRQFAFWLGFALLYISLNTQLDYYAEHEFFIHRIQHLVLHHLGPFILILSFPGTVLVAGLPLQWRTRWLRPLRNSAPVRGLLAVLLNPAVASIVFAGLVYLWLWPPVHFDAMIDDRLYRIMNWSMAVDGLIFWWLVLDRHGRPRSHTSPGLRVLIPLFVMMPQIFLGAYITFTSNNLYPFYALCGRAFTVLTAAQDQCLGGLIIWIPSAMMSVAAALLAVNRWMKCDAIRQRRLLRERRLAAAANAEATPPAAASMAQRLQLTPQGQDSEVQPVTAAP